MSLIGSGSSFSEGGWAAVTDAGIIRSSANSSNGLVLQAASGDMRFYVGGNPSAERLRITSAGQVRIETAAQGLRIGVDAANYAFTRDASGGDAGLLKFYGNQSSYTGYIFSGADGERLRITDAGRVTMGNVDTSSSSALHIRSSTSTETTLELSTKDNYNGSLPSAKISFTQQNGTEIARIKCDTNTGAANMADLTLWTNYGGLYERMRITKTGPVQIHSGSNSAGSLRIGGNYDSTGTTNSTAKLGTLMMPHYTNAEEPIQMIRGYSDSAQTLVSIGGGTSSANAATNIRLYTSSSITGTGVERARIESTGKFVLNNGASEYASGTITDVDQDVWYVASPTIQWSTYAVVGAIIMVCYEDNAADGHNLGAYFVGPATSAYAGATTTPFHRLHGSTDLEVKIDQVGGSGTRKLHFRCTHSSANGNSNKFLRWTIIRGHSY